ncbi:chemotaxis protein CheA [Halothiobacillus neapolitanus]|uniref:Chemotaxis protein CheA n=1 Tax=Halothiobacillus neapolitanus (strain ATCC 23641 / DSM 15147 / CIP 104769 / NCIMB 8539 / c2) TaxID=555778 RepID=D0KYP6_HALNC|nr:chemotaxis protein CheA [Halothiobacillus neapolitanus]ACX95569.1 CheA signal transduction histidine kinase [Halothiobacillus neapolitanus c2]TDN65872.1 two-component system chemotaxis sensor kinase CheA [Halothiobacillus neapolitanus]
MAFDADNELLQDFLIEAGELLDALDTQLVGLEQMPDDKDLLNAIFRAFHTIKGGAGFLEVTPLVEVCHRAEDIFNLLRNGELKVTPAIMDVMLRVLDALNTMFANLRAGKFPDSVGAAFLKEIEALSSSQKPSLAPSRVNTVSAAPPAQVKPEPVAQPNISQPPVASVVDSEFDQMLRDLESAEQTQVQAQTDSSAADDLITDEEFEALLDRLHGEGQFSPQAVVEEQKSAVEASSASDEITDEEFERVLDSLYGKGQGPTSVPVTQAEAAPANKTVEKALESAPVDVASAQPISTAATVDKAKPAPEKDKPQQVAEAPKQETTVRVDTERLDFIMNLVGELVLVRNRMNTLKLSFENEEVTQVIATLDMVTSDLQGAVMKTRMQPVKKVFGRFPRVVRDTARVLGKQVELVLIGEETDLDKNLVEALADPLIHLVRNSVDHGIEMPDVREAQGKPAQGTVTLSAAQEGDHIRLSISDDGAGMNAEVLRRKAVEKGLMTQDAASRLSEQECFELILLPGFSTKDQISDISGRGVGMDVVKTAITRLSGLISIDSEQGVGTTINIKVPLTLAILPTLMVVVSGRKYAIPLGIVSEIFEMADKEINVVDGQATIIVRDRALPLYRLNHWLALRGETLTGRDASDLVVMVQVGAQLIALVVDSVIGQEEVVIKPLGELLHNVGGFAGATITGDGHIALILDLPGLMRRHIPARSKPKLKVVA